MSSRSQDVEKLLTLLDFRAGPTFVRNSIECGCWTVCVIKKKDVKIGVTVYVINTKYNVYDIYIYIYTRNANK